MSQHIFNLRRALTLTALVFAVALGTFIYAGHVSSAKSVAAENALQEVPAATGIDTSTPLVW
jgi:hypothetical protein